MSVESGEPLDSLAALVSQGKTPEITGRQLLGLFGAERRNARVNERIRNELRSRGLRTEPDFAEAWVDAPILVRKLNGDNSAVADTSEGQRTVTDEPVTGQTARDPILRVGQLAAANQEVVTVQPGAPLKQVVTIMMMRDFSQIPVVFRDRDVKGAVTWQSVAMATALQRQATAVADCLVPVTEVRWNDGLLGVIPKLASSGFVLVRSPDRRIQGIVTVADLTLQFRDLAEPFLLLGQIENLLRLLIDNRFTSAEIATARAPADSAREVADASDLTFGEYLRLLEPHASWERLALPIDREEFLSAVRRAHTMRNDVMHFDPEPLGVAEMQHLRNLAAFLAMVVR